MSQETRRPYNYIKEPQLRYQKIATTPVNVVYIRNNLEKIIYIFDNNEYDQIVNMMTRFWSDVKFVLPVSELPSPPWAQALFERGVRKLTLQLNVLTPFTRSATELFLYCIYENNIELLKNIILKTGTTDLFSPFPSDWIFEYDFANNTNEIIWEIILEEMHLIDRTIEMCLDFFMRHNKINLLEKFLSRGHKMNQSHISDAINFNYCNIIQYVLSADYDMQQIFNECDLKIIRIHLSMVKILVEYHIDISAKIDDILICGVKSDELELVIYCVENNYNCDINSALEYACQCGYLDIITYLLRMGADVGTIDAININCNSIKLFKILVDYGFCIPIEWTNFIFAQCFTNISNDITDLLFLIEYGANPEFVFMWEMNNYDNMEMIVNNPRHYHRVNSHLEFIVSMGYISRIRYLLDINHDKLLLEVDRLFIVACANGQMDMVIYLLELGADINAELYMALNVACYFGHIDIVKFLLEKINLADITENLLMVVIHGWMSIIYEINEKNTCAPYRKLRGLNNILRNDVYNYGIHHKDIFELLISKNINLINLDILEILEMMPAYFFKLKFVSYIISIGFDVNTVFKRDVLDFKHATILELSVYVYDIVLVKYLLVKYILDNGANVTTNNDRLTKIVEHTPIEIKNLLSTYGNI